MLGTAESKIARALIGGHARSIAKAVMTKDDVKENIIKLLLGKLNEECASLCRKAISPLSALCQLIRWLVSSGLTWSQI